jgi:hypothetical protein
MVFYLIEIVQDLCHDSKALILCRNLFNWINNFLIWNSEQDILQFFNGSRKTYLQLELLFRMGLWFLARLQPFSLSRQVLSLPSRLGLVSLSKLLNEVMGDYKRLERCFKRLLPIRKLGNFAWNLAGKSTHIRPKKVRKVTVHNLTI